MASKAPSVALVGRRLADNENLGLAYLRSALEQAGISVSTHYVNDAGSLAKAAMAILAVPPDVVGLSLTDGGSALLPLTLGEALARGGYRGHITAGGPFATLARAFLLERYAFLHSVVRFAGELPLPALVHRVARGEAVFGIPSVTTRGGDGPPAAVLDPTPMVVVPKRDDLPEILGYRAAHLLATRGCAGRCAYCGPAALQSLERSEGLLGGASARTLTDHGVGAVRRRNMDDLCDDIAGLWHDRNVRYFYFVDEHMLPYDEPSALAFLDDLRRGLDKRHVGPRGFGTMLRADRLTPAIVRAFAGVGLVRAFVGLELAGDDEARRFSRKAPSARDLDLLRVFAAASVSTVSNLMLLHPYATPSTVRAGIQLMSAIPDGVVQVNQMMAYHGTLLAQRLDAEGRLSGNPLRHGYTFEDPTMTRFAEIFGRLRGESFRDYTVAFRTHDTYLCMGLDKRLHQGRAQPALEVDLDSIRRRVNLLFVDAYRQALDLAVAGGGYRDAEPLVQRMRGGAEALDRELATVESRLMRPGVASRRLFSPMRAAATCAFTFVVAGSAACGGGVTVPPPGRDGGVAQDAGAPPTTCPILQQPTGATAEQVQAVVAATDACFSGNVWLQPGDAGATVFADPLIALSLPLASPGNATLCADTRTTMEKTAAAALAAAHLQVGGQTVPAECLNLGLSAHIDGGASTDIQTMASLISAACSDADAGRLSDFRITLDPTGQATDVTTTPADSVLAGCMKAALAGLSFPCLANMAVCAEPVIVE